MSARRLRLAAALTVLALPLVDAGPAAPTTAFPDGELVLEGHGWGHGRGMGQYGALGYAVDHGRDAAWILDHFYRPTTRGTVSSATTIRVRLTALDGRATRTVSSGGLVVSGIGGTFGALRVRRVGANTFSVEAGPGCDGPWGAVATLAGPVRIGPASGGDENLVQVCEPGGTRRWYRGEIWATEDAAGSPRTVNAVNLEEYLRGVVPRESPASWGTKAGGKGMEALRAQAVAARSYAASEHRYGYADTCDTTACQVYRGHRDTVAGVLEHPTTDRAVAETVGEVRILGGTVARTEFSSSTGGWTAGVTFEPVPDDGDDVVDNPNHRWTARLPVASVEARYPGLGSLLEVRITRRNGYGDWGGRVQRLELVGTEGTVSLTGSQFRSAFGLKSDWFRVTTAPEPLPPAGYWAVSRRGGFYALGRGRLPDFGSAEGLPLAGPVTAAVAHPSGRGYYAVTSRGGVYAFGGVPFRGSAAPFRPAPIVDVMVSPDGRGYALVSRTGGVYAFGSFRYRGSMRARAAHGGVVAAAVHPSGRGYYLVTARGAVRRFGKVPFFGSAPSSRRFGIVDIVVSPDGNGYALVSRKGGVRAFGSFEFLGSAAAIPVLGQVVAAAAHPVRGYYLLTDRGAVYAFGAPFYGSATRVGHPGMVDLVWYPKSAP